MKCDFIEMAWGRIAYACGLYTRVYPCFKAFIRSAKDAYVAFRETTMICIAYISTITVYKKDYKINYDTHN